MKVSISPKAEKQLRKISKVDQIAIVRKIRKLTVYLPKDSVSEEKLHGTKQIYRIRVGSYRLLYKRTAAEIYIVLIGHGKQIYDLLKKIL